MDQPITPNSRPSRLPPFIHAIVLVLLLAAFVSGAVVWYGQTVNAGLDEPTFPIRGWLLLHGALNPFLCILFGYLLSHHIRYGWELRANWMTGLIMELTFAILILSGAGLYYFPEKWRATTLLIHHYVGLLLPLALIAHWIASHLWIKKISKSV
jgi:hypothetical protein